MQLHKSVRDFALKHKLRIRRDDTGAYSLVGPDGRAIDAPLQKGAEATAKGALAMLRRHVRGKNVLELSRIRKVQGLWVVQVLSAATGAWIVVSEWRTETEAKADLRNWRRSDNPSGPLPLEVRVALEKWRAKPKRERTLAALDRLVDSIAASYGIEGAETLDELRAIARGQARRWELANNPRRGRRVDTSKLTAAQKAKVRRVLRESQGARAPQRGRSRNPRGRSYRQAVKLFRDFHGEHPRFVDEYELPAPEMGVYIGPCDGILYTAKVDGKTERLVHEFTGRSRPIFAVSADGRDILLLGGDFKFTERGLVDGV